MPVTDFESALGPTTFTCDSLLEVITERVVNAIMLLARTFGAPAEECVVCYLIRICFSLQAKLHFRYGRMAHRAKPAHWTLR